MAAAAAVSQAQAPSGLAKDMSISSALMALIAQQQEETAVAERRDEVHRAFPVRPEDSGCNNRSVDEGNDKAGCERVH